MERRASGDALINKLSSALSGINIDKIETGTALTLLKMNSTKRKDYFIKNSFSSAILRLPKTDEFQLIKEKILFRIDNGRDLLTLTIKGIILLEYQLDRGDNKVSAFLNSLNNSYFLELIDRINDPLESQEKGVIIALLGLHAFTSETALKLSAYNERIQNMNLFKDCVDDALGFLKNLGVEYNDSTATKIWTLNVIGENPVAARINRLNNISLKTDQVYKKEGGNHYLDVLKDSSLDKDKVIFLLGKIFDKGALTFENRETLVSLLKSIQSKRYRVIESKPNFDNSEIRYLLHSTVEEFKTV